MNERGRILWLAGINIALALLAVGGLAAANWMVWNGNWFHREAPIFVMIGMLYGHVLFIAALWSMGPWRWQTRVPVLAAAWIALVAIEFASFVATHAGPPRPDGGALAILAASAAVMVGMLHLPLGPRFRRWRLQLTSPVENSPERRTFTIRDLFLWTTIVAFLLAGGRVLMAFLPTEGHLSHDGFYMIILFSQIATTSLLLSWPLFWALWSPGLLWKLPISIGIAVGATGLECYSLIATIGPHDVIELVVLIGCMNLMTYALLAMHVWTVRAFGYRLA